MKAVGEVDNPPIRDERIIYAARFFGRIADVVQLCS